ncbi:adhesion G protein-coupled receptor L2-like isoform X4 [Apostichopus japonicus]|uniref:adhesion G protein-coupled receptor L2-like isoform X4 n=1 Tax=Stichopus japonicus TaxID=307972 RepID=UPI003AB55717
MNQQRDVTTNMRRPLANTILFLLFLTSFSRDVSSSLSSRSNGVDDKKQNNSLIYYTSVCEGKTMDLQCPGERVILIESANFGRTDHVTCLGFGRVDDTNCESPATFAVVSPMCDYKTGCSIRATSGIFGNPCPGTFKFLEVLYECILWSAQTTTTPATSTASSSNNPLTDGDVSTLTVEVTSSVTTPTAKMETTTVIMKEPSTKPPSNICPGTSRRGISWPSTIRGVIVEKPCPEGSTGSARWKCVAETGFAAAWESSGPDLSQCQSDWVSNVTKLETEGANTTVVSKAILEKIDSSDAIYSSDIQKVSTYMSQSLPGFEDSLQNLKDEAKTEETHKVSQNYLEITSAILDNSNIDSWSDMNEVTQSESASNILSSLEESAFLLAETIEVTSAEEQMTVTLEESNVVMSIMVQDSSHGNPVDASFPTKHTMSSKWTNIEDHIIIPKENFDVEKGGKSKAVFLAYNNIQGFLGHHPAKPLSQSKGFVNSRIMSASLNSANTPTKLKEPVRISFAHIQENATNPSCSFWDFENSSYGEWSNMGCKVIKSNSTHTVCSCNHLTNFAILMNHQAVEISVEHSFVLSVITYFGFIISSVCLLLAFITFCMFKNLQNDRTTIHKNLCLTLLIAEVIFMAGISQVGEKIVCSIIAMVLHYFFLSAFAWMCLEGIQLYVMLVEVFEAESSRRKYYYPFGYGLPAVVVAVSAALNFHGYGTETYCWLSTDKYFIWAFVAPICLIILVNTVFLTMAMFIMCRHSKLQTNPKEKNMGEKFSEDQLYTPSDKLIVGNTRMEYISLNGTSNNFILPHRSWLRGALVLLCLLGITWVFGLAYVNANMIVFAYIFTIFNVLQGMFIFLFHCLMNDKVRKEYRRYIRNSTWLPACIRDNYGGVFTSNSNQQQSFRSSSSGRGRAGDSKRLSNTTGSYSFDQRNHSSSSACRFSGEYMPIQSPPPIDSDHVESYDYEEVPDNAFMPTSISIEAEGNSRNGSQVHDEGIGLELEGHPTWNDKPSVVVVDNASGDLARFSKTDLVTASMEALQREKDTPLRESGIDSQPASPDSECLPSISYHVQRSHPNLATVKPLRKEDLQIHRESGIGASHSESDRSSASSEQMCPGSPVITPDEPSKAHIFPNPASAAHPNHTSMPDLVYPVPGRRAQFNEVPPEGSNKPNFLSLPKKSHSSVGVGEAKARRAYSDAGRRRNPATSSEAELYVPQTFSRIETMI